MKNHQSNDKKSRLLLIFIFLLSIGVYGRGSRHLTIRDGLSNSAINCIYQDSCGLVWFGTWDGLNQYNSRDIKVFKSDVDFSRRNISNNIIRHIVEERKGLLWISTDYGINRYDVSTDEFQSYFCANADKEVFREHSFFVNKDSRGHVFALVNEYGLYVYDEQKEDFVRIELNIDFAVKQMFFSAGDTLWLCADNGALYTVTLDYTHPDRPQVVVMKQVAVSLHVDKIFYNPVQNNVWLQTTERDVYHSPASCDDFRKAKIQIAEKITAMAFKDSCCYVGTLQRLYRWEDSRETMEILLDNLPINSLYLGEQNLLWVGTDSRGVFIWPERRNKFRRSSELASLDFGNAPVRTFWQTKDENLFIGTKGSGLFIQSGKHVRNLTYRDGLLHNSVYALTGDKENTVWICTEECGLNYYSVSEQRLWRVSHTPDALRALFSICQQNDSVLWVGTNGQGVFKLLLDKTVHPFSVKAYEQYCYQFNTDNCLNNNSVYTLLLDADRGLWIGTRGGGLNYLDFATGTFSYYRASDCPGALSNDDILCLYQDADSTLWIGTSNGLNHLTDRVNGEFCWYSEKDGIPNNTIHGILRGSQNSLWISTNRGLARLDKDSGKIISYFQTDGLQDDEFSDGAFYASPYSARLYFGGMNGYTAFDPSEIKEDCYMPQLYLKDFSINNVRMPLVKRLDKKGRLCLSYDENLVIFRFVPIDYVQSPKCEITYRLKGYSEGWIDLGASGTIVLNNLPTGRYTLSVRCRNANKEWSSGEYDLFIQVLPPWWLSWWAYLVYALLFTVCAIFLYRNSVHRLRMKQKLRMEKMESQKAEEIHQAKLRFFTNIAHEFCNSLTLIYGPSERLFKLCNDNPVLKRYLQVIKSNAERMQELIQQLMEFRKVETGYLELFIEETDIQDLVEHTAGNFVELAEEKSIDFTQSLESGAKTWNTDRGAFEKILFNLLSNAFKYTPDKGRVSVHVECTDGHLVLTVRNTGKGIRKEDQSIVFNRFKVLDRLEDQILTAGSEMRNGIGLALCKSLVNLLQGSICIDSQENEYAAFIVRLPRLAKSAIQPEQGKGEEVGRRLTLSRTCLDEQAKEVEESVFSDELYTVLVVDDDAEVRELLSDILRGKYNVLSVSDAREAIELLQLRIPDLIICDVIMPGMSGFELLNMLKKDELTAHIPILLLSSDASVDSKIEGTYIGADAYLTKPFHEGYLLAVVDHLLSNRQKLKDYFNSPISSIERVEGKLLHKEDKEFIHQLSKTVVANLQNEGFSQEFLAQEMGISKMQLYRKLRDIKGETPTDFIRNIRLKQAESLLKTTNKTVQEIMYECGFNNKAYFYRAFAKQFGSTPKEYRDRCKA